MKPAIRLRMAGRLVFVGYALLFLSGSVCLRANPVGEEVVAGQAQFDRAGSTLTIHTGDRVIINWQDFSIAGGELTKFVQPDASSAALNRVVSGNPSSIFGTLQANGQVFLINPNGILVGGGAVIDTGGFVASTLDIGNSEFLRGGNLNFTGSSTASILNQGNIKAIGGDIILIARQVDNAGTLSAPSGNVGIGVGNEVLLAQSGAERVFVKPSPSLGTLPTGIVNSGVIEAARVELKAHGNLYALAINNQGMVRATGAVNENGRVILTAQGGNIENSGILSAKNTQGAGGIVSISAGHLEAGTATVTMSGIIDAAGSLPGAKGGEVEILGDRLALLDGMRLDVSGDGGGGRANVGGSRSGEGPLPNSHALWIGAEAVITASAGTTGDGGEVILFAEDTTRIFGRIDARGGAEAGDGGFVETSGKATLEIRLAPDLSAPRGLGGTWLIDPNNIEIVAGGGSVNMSGGPAYASTGDGAQLGADLIAGSLNAGTSVSVTTGTGAPNLEQGDITISSAIAKTAGGAATLTLSAHDDIFINAAVSSTTGALNMSFTADSDSSGAGSVTLGATGSITTNGGTFTAIGANFTQAAGGTINSGAGLLTIGTTTIDLGGAADSIQGTGGVTLRPRSTATTIGLGTGAGTFSLSSTELATLRDGFAVRTFGQNTGTAAIIVDGALSFPDPVTITGSLTSSTTFGPTADITFVGSTTLTSGAFSQNNGALINFGSGGWTLTTNTIDLAGAADSIQGTGAPSFRTYSGGRPILIGAAGGAGDLAFTAAELATLKDGFTFFTFGQAASTSTTTFDGVVVFNDRITVTGNASSSIVFSATSNVTFNGTGIITLATGTLTQNNGAQINFGSTDPVFASNTIDLAGAADSIQGTGSLAFRPFTTARPVVIGAAGGAGDMAFTAAEIATLKDGFGSIAFGGTTGGALTVDVITFYDPVTLNPTSASGSITIDGQLTGAGNAAITLNSAGNTTLNAGIVTAGNAVSIQDPVLIGSDVTMDSTNGGVSAAGAGITFNSTIDSSGGARDLTLRAGTGGAVSVTGAIGGTTALDVLNVVSASTTAFSGAITANTLTQQSGTGLTTFTAGGTIGSGGLDVTATGITVNGAISTAAAGSNVEFDAGTGTFTSAVAGTISAGAGSVTLTADSIALSGALTGNGGITIQPSTATRSIGLNDAGGLFNLTSAELALLASSGTVTVGAAGGSGAVTIGSLGAIDLSAESFGLALRGGALTFNNGITLADNETLSINASSVTGFGGTDITIGGAAGTMAFTTAGDVTVQTAVAQIGASTVGGMFALTNLQSINDTGTITVTGATTLNAGANNITLDQALSTFGTLALTGNNVAVTENAATDLGASTIGGTFNLTSAGNVIDSGVLTITGTTTINAGASDITLNTAANTFGTLVLTGNDITIVENAATGLGAVAVTGTLSLNSAGAITQTAAMGANALVMTSGGTITLINAGNTIGSLGAINSGGTLQIFDSAGGLDLNGAVTVAGANDATIQTSGALNLNNTIAAQNITLVTDLSFVNTAGAAPLTPAGGRFLIYSVAPSANTLGGITANFTQYNITYPLAPSGAGNGLLYSTGAPPTDNSELTYVLNVLLPEFADSFDRFERYRPSYWVVPPAETGTVSLSRGLGTPGDPGLKNALLHVSSFDVPRP